MCAKHYENPTMLSHVTAKNVGDVFLRHTVKPELWAIEVYIERIGILDVFGSCDLDLDPMTFIYELDSYCLEVDRMYKYELPMSRLSKVIL